MWGVRACIASSSISSLCVAPPPRPKPTNRPSHTAPSLHLKHAGEGLPRRALRPPRRVRHPGVGRRVGPADERGGGALRGAGGGGRGRGARQPAVRLRLPVHAYLCTPAKTWPPPLPPPTDPPLNQTNIHNTHPTPSTRLIAHALDVRAKDLGMTVEELRALPPGRPRRSKHDDMTCLVRLLFVDGFLFEFLSVCIYCCCEYSYIRIHKQINTIRCCFSTGRGAPPRRRGPPRGPTRRTALT